MICPSCGVPLPEGYTRCAKCGVDLLAAVGLSAPDGPYETRASGPNRPYVAYRGWPWATLSTVSQTRSQFMTSLAVGAVGIVVTFLLLGVIGFWWVGALLALLFTGVVYLGWRAGRRGAGWR